MEQFTKIIDLIYLAKQQGVEIVLNGERLQLKVPENKSIDPNLREEIRNNKQEIIDFLNNDNWKSKRVDQDYNKIDRFDRKAVSHIPLSFSQERLWFIDQLEKPVLYNLPTVMRLKGNLNKEALVHAMQTVVSRHEVLRTIFLEAGGQPYQLIKEAKEWQLSIVDGAKYKRTLEDLEKYIGELIITPFDLSKDYMVRASLIRLDDEEHVLVVTMHHIASDAWSMPVIVREVMELYNAHVEKRPAQLMPLPIQYADYALWQRNYLQGEVLEKKIDYWKNKLGGVIPLQLPTDYTRPAVKGVIGSSFEFSIEKNLSDKIQMFCQQQGTTLYMTLLAAFKVLLHRYSNQQDICVGTSIANRNQKEAEELIGYFVNTLALRSEVKSEVSFIDLLQQVRATMMQAYEHQDVPFEKVVEAVVKARDASRSPLFQVMLVLQNTPEIQALRLGDVQLAVEEFAQENAKFDITFFINETASGLKGRVEYSIDLYRKSTINLMAGHFKTLLNSIVKSPQQKIGELQMLTKDEEQQLLVNFYDSTVDYPKNKTIVDLFEKQAIRTPDEIAIFFEDHSLTYKALNERSNQLAHYLRSKGVKEDTLVPLCIERSHEMMIGILGILKAGGAYVPIEPDFPEERKSFVLEDTAARLIVSSTQSSYTLPALDNIDIIEIDDQWSALRNQPVNNVQTDLYPGHLAYIIYTSGSTGKPKGVMIEHRNLVDYVFGLKQHTHIDECKSYALVSSIATDLGNTVIYSSLVFGGSLHIFSKEAVSNIELLHNYFEEHSIDCLKIVPSHWKALSMGNNLLLPGKLLVFGGEALQSEIVENIRQSGSGCRVVNHYGPTETTIGKLLHVTDVNRNYNSTIPIGKPFSNTSVYVLTKTLELCPVGIPGELHVAGDGVARGYLNNSELTRQKFIENPFDKESRSLMYSTGDMVRYLADGDIEFIGRVDDQVKIRGYRVELGEIENMLLQSELVNQAVVLAKEDKDGSKRLVGYIVGAEDFDKELLVSYLKEKLPDYMVPGQWVEMKNFPLLPNGKIDRKTLPDPEVSEQLGGQYIAPRNEVESRLTMIWQDVLEADQVGIYDDFFELGGHSLLAIRLISAIRKEFAVEMPIGDVFDYPTIALLATQLEKPSDASVLPAIEVASSRPAHIPLSFSQERLWFIDQLEGSMQYHVPAVLRLKGELNKKALANALHDIVDRHEVLRTIFLQDGGRAYQFIKEVAGWQISIVEGAKYRQDPAGLQQYIQELIRKPFDLSKDYMVRAHLITLSEEDQVLVVTKHHIASDGWSTSILVKEVMELYTAYVEERPAQLAPLPIQYADYAIWQHNYLQGEVLKNKLDYWKSKLEEVVPLQLPTDFVRPAVRNINGASTEFNIGKELSNQLQLINQQQGTTLYMTLLAAFKVLLHRYSGQQDICVGSPIANRTQQEVEGLIGFFVNTLALRSEVKSEASFSDFLQQVRATMMEAYEHQDVPFEKVVELIVKERDLSRSPLFQVMFILQNNPEVKELRLGEVQLSVEEFAYDSAKFDISFTITETAEGLQGIVKYSTDLYTESTIIGMMDHFKTLLHSIVKSPQQKIGELQMLTSEEEHQLLVAFNDTAVDYPKDKSIVDLFEEQAAKTPEATAVVFEEKQLTYKELNEKANQLAHYLRSKGVKEERLVPICIERSLEMIVGILGILKAGGAYVPIDTDFPEERISYMLEDTGASIVVTTKESRSKLQAASGIEIIELDSDWSSVIGPLPTTNYLPMAIGITLKPHYLAYVIYTSGSTGRPKGVMIEHRNLVDYVFGLKQKTRVDQCRSFALVSTIATDLGNTVIYSSLVFGGTLHLFSKEAVSNIENLHRYFKEHTIDCLKIVPSHWKALCDEQLLLPAKLLVFGGEALPAEVVENIRLSGSACKVVNHYGPTETTIGKLLHVVGKDRQYSFTIPIGRPFSNTRTYVLNKALALCPVGVPGQLYIAGDGLARGYLNNAELTKEKFIQNPFNGQDRSLMYGTGDLVKYLADGNIEFIGRVDDQVKIRGYRIELGEIETALQQCEGVGHAVVLAREDNSSNKRLIGYVVADGLFNKEAIVTELKSRLPEYMIPALWMELESLPLTANGKIDRKALPEPDAGELLSGLYVAPRNEVEEKLVTIWKDLLHVEQVGIHDNFFELGGHSLLAMRVISAIRKELQVELAIKYLFVHPTISALADHLKEQGKKLLLPAIEVQARPEHIPLSFSQERLWFIDRMEGSTQYHVPAVLRLRGELNKEALANALQDIVNRHEVLRTVILEQEGMPFQSIKIKDGWKLSIVDGAKYAEDNEGLKKYLEQIINKPFDLSKDYMIRGHLIILNDKEHVLVITLHHIASDGWSRYILVNEVVKLYRSYIQDVGIELEPLPIQYVDYAIWQRQYLEGEVLDKKLAYWKDKLQEVKVLRLPTDFVRPDVQTARGSMVDFNIDIELSEQIRQLSKKQGTTLFMTLLAAFKVLLHRYSGQQDICVGTAIAGRQQQEMEGLIGFFVNTLALRSEVNGEILFTEFLQQVRITSMEAYENQEVPFEKVVDAMIGKRDLGTDPLVQVLFALQNTPEIEGFHLGELELIQDELAGNKALFELFFNLRETPQGIVGSMQYATDLYSEGTINRMIGHFKELLISIVKAPQQKIGELAMLTREEEQQLLKDFNDTAVDYPKDKTIVNLFEEQAAKTPEATAVVFEKTQLTYKELNERANQLAQYLRSRGVKEETLVPICIERSLEMIVGILGILKADGAYVPIDPEYPQDRINYMLEDTNATIVLTSKESRSKIQASAGIEIIEMDKDWSRLNGQLSPDGYRDNYLPMAIGTTLKTHHLAYIIYTSGSTGKPKGVMIEHRNVGSLVKEVNYVSLTDKDILLSTGSPSFDATTFEYWSMLLNGGQLIICKENKLLDSELLKEEIEKRKVTKMWFTSSWFNQLVETDISIFARLDTILVGGEKLSEQHIKKIRQTYPSIKIVNGYGPTENTTFSLTYNITDIEENTSIPIGYPLTNRSVYILNEKHQLVPVNITGEIYLGGDGLARGYLNRPELTKEKFIKNPLSKEEGSRLYRTGDLGRWLPGGKVEYLGRIDDQVKIRGYRIELGEIESVLNEIEYINSSCVVVKKDLIAAKRLVSYYIPKLEIIKAKERELYSRLITSWKELYETEYEKTEGEEENIDVEFNIIGWNDSFTGKGIPEEDMREWLEDIVEVIMSENAQNVLEIGSGTGLIYYQLAGKIKKYIGTDFSRSSMNQITQRISKGLRDYGPTELQVCAAHEVSIKQEEEVDTVILNSIVQYFPGEDYMTDVIGKSISVLKNKGRIIIGDVRDNRLLELFKGRLYLKKMQPSLGVNEFKWAVQQDAIKEEELCFSPDYFFKLQSKYPQITHVEIKWKHASYINELSLYRYTVIIYVGEEAKIFKPTWQSWNDVTDMESIASQLENDIAMVAIKNVPNPRLVKERFLNKALANKTVKTVGDIIDYLETEDKESLEINELLNIVKAKGYHYRLLLDEDPLKMNVLIEQKQSHSFIEQPYSETGFVNNTSSTNIPLFNDISSLLQKDIRALLQQRLPEYMVPSEMIALLQLPLTRNGKVDRMFLSEREDRGFVNTLNYQPAVTEAEHKLVGIWQELLALERIGIHDNFFELGGHSLIATRMISAIRKQLKFELSIKDLFLNPTIAELARHLNGQSQEFLLPSIEIQLRPGHIPLSFSQERLWFIDQLEGSVQYHVPAVLGLKGSLNKKGLEYALQSIVARHEVLRTVILEEEGKPYQSIKDKEGWQLEMIDGLFAVDREGLQQYIQELIRKPFDLSKDYMVRAHLITLNDEEHVLIVTMHHIASDGWSMSVIVKEVAELYKSFVEERPVQLSPLPIQYADYAIWQRNYLQGEVLERKLSYWKQKLGGVVPLQLPTDHQRPAVWSTHGTLKRFSIDKALSGQLQLLSQQQGTTLYMTLLAAFKVLLYRYSGQPDICVGSPIANRTQQEIEGLIGFFVNTLALRTEVNGEAMFTDLLQQVRATTMGAYEHQEVPFEKVVEVVVKERDLSRSPLFQVMFALQNIPEVPQLRLGDVTLSPKMLLHNTTKFDVTFLLTETANGLQGSLEYATDLYNESTIDRLMVHFKTLLSSIAKAPQQKIGELAMLTKAEEQQLLGDFNDTTVDYPKDKTIVDLFEEQVTKTPAAKALIFEEEHLTYQQLNEKANQLAHYLRSKGVKQEILVPICIERSLEMIIGILGILKAGGAYVPIDPEYPQERISYMLEDTGAAIVITSKTSRSKLKASIGIEVIELDTDWSPDGYRDNGQLSTVNRQPSTLQPHHLAYVIYTSGSTGKPKGVMIEHRNASAFISWCRKEFSKSHFEIVYASTSICFDLSVFEIFYPLSVGKQMRIIESGLDIDKYLSHDRCVLINSVPVVVENLLKEGTDLNNVTVINMAGEPISLYVQQNLDTENIEVRNLYGPTEDTTYSTLFRLKKKVPVLVGKPISNTSIYILNERNQLSPVGVTGEICIGGAGLARGYLHLNELTAEKFIADPFNTEPGSRIYKTGDVGRWLADGNIEYLGRKDNQVKIRGYRIELGEIENVLQQTAGVSQAVVMAKADGNGSKRLVGYVVPSATFNKEAIVIQLRKRLPEYMVPAVWLELDSLPLTPNGKIDRKALPDPGINELRGSEYTAPRNEVEEKLVAIWQELLKVEKVGVYDNFFELGGHSLLAIRVISAIRKHLNVELAIKDLFHFTTINDLSKYVEIQTTYSEEKASAEYELLDL